MSKTIIPMREKIIIMKDKLFIIIRTKKGYRFADYIGKELNLKGHGHTVLTINEVEKFIKDNNLNPKNLIIHTRTASPDKVYKILKNLEKKGFNIINKPETIRLTSDKYLLCEFAIKSSIPCAETKKIMKEDAEKEIKHMLQTKKEIIVKPVVSNGQGIYCLKLNNKNLQELDKIPLIPSQELVLQEFVKHTRLNRIIVIGFKGLKECVFYDEPNQNSWKCSVCLNPKIKHYKNPPKKLIKMAEDIAKKFNADICFIDIFSTKDGYVLNEINTACSLIIHEMLSKFNISKEIAKYLIKKSTARS